MRRLRPVGKPYAHRGGSDLAEIKWLFTSGKDIADLTGIEHLVNLMELTIVWANISVISPLASLTRLESLDLKKTR